MDQSAAPMAPRARKLDKSVHSAGQTAFCELMVKARKSAGLTQQELAKRLHKPQSFVAKYEAGERRVDVVEFVTICKAIGADPAKLLRALLKVEITTRRPQKAPGADARHSPAKVGQTANDILVAQGAVCPRANMKSARISAKKKQESCSERTGFEPQLERY